MVASGVPNEAFPAGKIIEAPGWVDDPTVLHLARMTARCRVLGPGTRAVIWVQGCPFRCRGCVASEWLPFMGGDLVQVEDLANAINALADIDGVTFSGGEPFAQSAALASLIDMVRSQRDLSIMSYSGYTLEQLTGGSTAQRGLLERLDILIDGPYIEGRRTDLRWRGSENQRVHFLTDRHVDQASAVTERGTWLEFEALPGGEVGWMGIPPAGLRATLDGITGTARGRGTP